MGILEIAIAVLLIIWIGGFFLHLFGGLIHLVLALAVILIVARVLGFHI